MFYHNNTSEPLLNKTNEVNRILFASLPFVVLLSSVGTVVIKTGQNKGNLLITITGLMTEGLAFLIYPISMRVYSLRTITICWSGGSILTGVIGGYLLFDEIPSKMSLMGCLFVIIGIVFAAS